MIGLQIISTQKNNMINSVLFEQHEKSGNYAQDMLDAFKAVATDPIEFLRIVRTRDEVDKVNPVKPFPIDLEYLQFYVRLWQRENFIAVPKSRRMKMSWINLALIAWDVMFNYSREWACVSKKEEDSDELIKRIKFIYENLDQSKIPKELFPKVNYKYCSIEIPEMHSRAKGYPSGANQLRQYTFSGILGDECAFWDDAQEMYKGSLPTTEGGGRMILISSVAPGFFKKLVYDQLDSELDFDATLIESYVAKEPMQGVKIWKNPKNDFCIFDLHYTADPAKRSKEFINSIRLKLPKRDWQQEYEKVWDSFEGMPVYEDWNKKVHATMSAAPQIGLPLLRGWDFGLTPACVIGQLQGNKLIVLREFTALNQGVDKFSDWVLPSCNMLFPGYDWIDFIDPAGVNRDQSNEGSCAQVLDSKGLKCIAGEVTFVKRQKAVTKFLTTFDKGEPCFEVYIPGCTKIIQGFDGGYCFADTSFSKDMNAIRPVKNEYSHPHDALQYIASSILLFKKTHSRVIPRVSYSFGKDLQTEPTGPYHGMQMRPLPDVKTN